MASAAAPAGSVRSREGASSLSFAFNVAGIYVCFMSCGLLHESIYRTRSASGGTLSPWLVNAVEAGVNVVVALGGRRFWEGVRPLSSQGAFVSTGSFQVFAKYLASAARVHGVPGPVQTLVKTARPLPVMLGQRLLAGTLYSPREYAQYVLFVASSLLVGTARDPLPTDGISAIGLLCLLLSCLCDGYVGGRQKALKATVQEERRAAGLQPEALGPMEMQLFTNLYMLATASALAVGAGGLGPSLRLLAEAPSLVQRVLQYAGCSAIGQIFVFICVTRADPLVLAMVTSSRKLASVVKKQRQTCVVALAKDSKAEQAAGAAEAACSRGHRRD
mmetsp:Transcript_108941/g.347466  ORF Transcript_108941/g.347466 Transcript_108941/m.347466 type:complete len:332 (+) Transcript_108941:53-1048(+)